MKFGLVDVDFVDIVVGWFEVEVLKVMLIFLIVLEGS